MMARLTWPSSLPMKEPLGWGLATVLCFILLLLLTFPYASLHARVLAEISRTTGMDVRVTDWSVSPPLGLEWRDMVLAGPDRTVPIESLRVSIGLLPALVGRMAVDYLVQVPGTAQTGTGRANGSLTSSSWSFQEPMTLKGRFQQIDLASILKPYVSRGLLQGDFTQRMESPPAMAAGLKGDGHWKVEVKDLVIERIQNATINIPSLTFSRITALVNCQDTVCDVAELRGDGADGSFSAAGRIMLEHPIQQSQLDLSVTLSPGAGFAQKSAGLGLPPFQPGTQLTVKLAGSIQQPRVIL